MGSGLAAGALVVARSRLNGRLLRAVKLLRAHETGMRVCEWLRFELLSLLGCRETLFLLVTFAPKDSLPIGTRLSDGRVTARGVEHGPGT